jgi:hypothetical protein
VNVFHLEAVARPVFRYLKAKEIMNRGDRDWVV